MPRPPAFEITDSRSGSALTVQVAGELDLNTAQALSEHVDSHLGVDRIDLVLDLRAVSFMDSSALRFLIELTDRCRENSWQLNLIAPEHDAALLVLRVTGADNALPFERSGKQ
jgi:anti-sigma B factor antagonist